MPRRPEHLDLGLLLPTGQPGHLPGDLTGHSRHFFVPASSVSEEEEGVNQK